MINSAPMVSVIVPVLNTEKYIKETLDSILRESEANIEVVVIDDGSTDGSRRVIEQYADNRIRLIDGPRQGHGAVMNAGIRAARGSYLVCCDSDDLMPPKRISEQLLWLHTHPEFGAVCGAMSTIDTHGRIIHEFMGSRYVEEVTSELMQGETRTSLCTYMIRAEALKNGLNFRSWFRSGGDIDFQLRLVEGVRIGYEPVVRYIWRIHQQSITHSQTSGVREFYVASAKAFQRQRQVSGQDDLDRGASPLIPDFSCSAPQTSSEHIGMLLLGQAWEYHRQGRRLPAFWVGLRLLRANPMRINSWKNVLALLIK